MRVSLGLLDVWVSWMNAFFFLVMQFPCSTE